jgi:hypothetical protein
MELFWKAGMQMKRIEWRLSNQYFNIHSSKNVFGAGRFGCLSPYKGSYLPRFSIGGGGNDTRSRINTRGYSCGEL